MKIKSSRIGDLSFTDIGISCPNYEFLTSQICVLTLFAKIKLSQKNPNLQYLMWFLVSTSLAVILLRKSKLVALL